MLPLRGDMSALLRHVSTEAHQSARAYPTKRMIGRLQSCHPRIDAVSSIISEQRRLTFERDSASYRQVSDDNARTRLRVVAFLSVWFGRPDGIGASIIYYFFWAPYPCLMLFKDG